MTKLFFALAFGSLLTAQELEGKSAELVSAINELDTQWVGVNDLEAVPTGPAFFSLVMLEQLADNKIIADIGQLTQSAQWREKTPDTSNSTNSAHSPNRTGWSQLDNIWWLRTPEVPSRYGARIAEHYRTRFVTTDFHSRAVAALPIAPLLTSQSAFTFDSVLLTQATYSPKIPGGLSAVAGSPNKFQVEGAESQPVQFLQTQILPVQWHESGKELLVRISLADSSGWLTFGTNQGTALDSVPWVAHDAILFLPQTAARSDFRPARHGQLWSKLVGPESNYSRAIEYSQLTLNDWIIQSQVYFQPHQANLPPHPTKQKAKQPKVLSLDQPFFYHIQGPDGETIFRGKISSPNIK